MIRPAARFCDKSLLFCFVLLSDICLTIDNGYITTGNSINCSPLNLDTDFADFAIIPQITVIIIKITAIYLDDEI